MSTNLPQGWKPATSTIQLDANRAIRLNDRLHVQPNSP